MKAQKLLKIFKKSGGKGATKKADGGFSWPSGVRVGVYGHANAGKTVYFTVLNEDSKVSKDLQISVIDNATAGEFLSHYRSIWGLGSQSGVGTAVDLRGEKRFPEPTTGERLLLFNAILDRSTKVPIVTYDYNGKAVSISEMHELQEKVADFMTGCDGILFFFDPKVLGAELVSQAHVASFVNMLERLVPLKARLPIPIALVVTKADILDGFTGESQVILVSPEDEKCLSEDFEMFLERVLSSNRVASNQAWAGTVRNVLVRLREFLKVVVGRTLDFQVFFVSNTGQTPERIGTDVGRSIYTPPAKIRPVGVKEPFHWLLSSVIRNRKISRFRAVAKFVATVCFIWILIYSLPHIYHYAWLLNRTTGLEDQVLASRGNNIFNIPPAERSAVLNAYDNYYNSKMVRWLFDDFRVPANQIRTRYRNVSEAGAVVQLNDAVKQFSEIVRDQNLWPKPDLQTNTPALTDRHKQLEAELLSFQKGDQTTPLYRRSVRVQKYWELFKNSVVDQTDTTVWSELVRLVQQEESTSARELSEEEKDLGRAIKERRTKKVAVAQAKEVSKDIGGFTTSINANLNPSFRLDTAVTQLRTLRTQFEQAGDDANVKMIDAYLTSAARFKQRQRYTCKIETVPGTGHLHIEVTDAGRDPSWGELTQIFAKDPVTFSWKMGDDIHIALDTSASVCQWGKNPSDEKVLNGDYSLFQMEGQISFDNVGKKVAISFTPPLTDQLPTLK
ncbi:MAG: GTPase domain-containing protein [Candidatus Zixiibacteriota bacterium]